MIIPKQLDNNNFVAFVYGKSWITVREFISNKDAGVISHGNVHTVVTYSTRAYFTGQRVCKRPFVHNIRYNNLLKYN